MRSWTRIGAPSLAALWIAFAFSALTACAGGKSSSSSAQASSTGGGTGGGSWVTASGAACTNGPTTSCEWTTCKNDPMPSVVYYVCSVGGDDTRTAAQAQNPATPWATAANVTTVTGDNYYSFFSSLPAGAAVAFCRGGSFTAPHARWNNTNGTQASPVIVRDYTRPGRAGMGDPRPVFTGPMSQDVKPGNVKFENLAVQDVAAGNNTLFFSWPATTDVTYCNNEISGGSGTIGIQAGTDTNPMTNARVKAIGNRIINTAEQGVLMAGLQNEVTDNYFYNTGYGDTVFGHPIYMGGSTLDLNDSWHGSCTVSRNTIITPNTGSAQISIHGPYDPITVEDNYISTPGGSDGAWGIALGGAGYIPYYDYIANVVVRGNTTVNAGNLGIGVATCKNNCLVENNLVINTAVTGRGIGAPFEPSYNRDPKNNGITVRNNTIYLTHYDPGHMGWDNLGIQTDQDPAAANSVIENNVVQVASATNTPYCYKWGANSLYSSRDYNVCYGGHDAAVGSHSLVANPMWVSPGVGGNFEPAAGSPLIGAGDPAQKPTLDIIGATRPATPSIGAYEPSSTPATLSWSTGYWRPPSMSATAIDFAAYTHIVHTNVIYPVADGTIAVYFPGTQAAVLAAAHAAGKKVLVGVGSSNDGPAFKTIAASPALRAAFVANTLAFMAASYGGQTYDGIDLDYEDPDSQGSTVADFAALVTGLRAAVDAPGSGKLLTMPVGPWFTSWWVPVVGSLDQANMMSYYTVGSDLASLMAPVLAAGAPASKLGIGFGMDPSDLSGTTAEVDTTTAEATAKMAYVRAQGFPGVMTWGMGRNAVATAAVEAAISPFVK